MKYLSISIIILALVNCIQSSQNSLFPDSNDGPYLLKNLLDDKRDGVYQLWTTTPTARNLSTSVYITKLDKDAKQVKSTEAFIYNNNKITVRYNELGIVSDSNGNAYICGIDSDSLSGVLCEKRDANLNSLWNGYKTIERTSICLSSNCPKRHSLMMYQTCDTGFFVSWMYSGYRYIQRITSDGKLIYPKPIKIGEENTYVHPDNECGFYASSIKLRIDVTPKSIFTATYFDKEGKIGNNGNPKISFESTSLIHQPKIHFDSKNVMTLFFLAHILTDYKGEIVPGFESTLFAWRFDGTPPKALKQFNPIYTQDFDVLHIIQRDDSYVAILNGIEQVYLSTLSQNLKIESTAEFPIDPYSITAKPTIDPTGTIYVVWGNSRSLNLQKFDQNLTPVGSKIIVEQNPAIMQIRTATTLTNGVFIGWNYNLASSSNLISVRRIY